MRKRIFITWVTHNSRMSERMIKFRVKKDEGYFLEDEDRVLIYDLICEKLEDLWIKDFTLNVLSDHVHLVFMVEENDLSKIMKNIKWAVSFKYLKLKWFTKSWDWVQNKLWAKSFSKTYLDTDENYEKAIKYTLTNHKKHEINNIYQLVNRGF